MELFKCFMKWWNLDTQSRLFVDEEVITRPGSKHHIFKCKTEEEALQFMAFAQFMQLCQETELAIVFSNLSILLEIFNSLPKKYHLWITDGKLNYAPIMESY